MAINFTVNVPDEWWVDSWSNNDTLSYTLPDEAPSHFWYLNHEGTDNQRIFFDSDEAQGFAMNDGWTSEKLACADYPAAAAHEWHRTRDHTYTTENVTMKDGQVYKKKTNPLLSDLFTLDDSLGKPKLNAMIKYPTTYAEHRVATRKTYVSRYNNVYDFESSVQTKIDNFLAAADSYATMMATVYPWQLDSLNDTTGCFATPKVPTDLITVFSGLPTPPNTPDLE